MKGIFKKSGTYKIAYREKAVITKEDAGKKQVDVVDHIAVGFIKEGLFEGSEEKKTAKKEPVKVAKTEEKKESHSTGMFGK